MKRNRLRPILSLAIFAVLGCLVALYTYWNRRWENTNFQNRQHQLCDAAWHGDLPTVTRLMNAGAKPNTAPRDLQGRVYRENPLGEAVRMGHEDVTKYLLDHGADANGAEGERNPLVRVCWSGYPHPYLSMAKLLLDHGADPNAPLREDFGPLYYTPISAARGAGRANLVELLRHYGAHD